MTDDTNTDAWIEAQPVFIASQLRPGHTLTDADVTAIQAVLSELNNREETDVEIFHNGRIAGFHEIGGQALVDAVQRKDDAFINTHSFSDGVDGARAIFRHSVQVTGEVAQLPEDALLKWACVYYLGRLTEAGLKEAFSSLQGIHTFEAENAQIAAARLAMIEHAAPAQRKKITAARKQELKPLEISE